MVSITYFLWHSICPCWWSACSPIGRLVGSVPHQHGTCFQYNTCWPVHRQNDFVKHTAADVWRVGGTLVCAYVDLFCTYTNLWKQLLVFGQLYLLNVKYISYTFQAHSLHVYIINMYRQFCLCGPHSWPYSQLIFVFTKWFLTATWIIITLIIHYDWNVLILVHHRSIYL